LKDWRNAEHDLLVTMPVDLAEWVVRRLFCVAELGSKVDATRSVAVLANGLLAVRMAKTVARDKILRVAEQ
jgi:HSP20 family molecular chaperone IbpA